MVHIGNFIYKYRNAILPLLFFGVFIPSPVIFFNPIVALVVGLTISVTGQVIRMGTIGLVYIIRGGKDGKVYAKDLVTTGIFSHCRNPLYVGNILVGSGMGLASNSLIFFVVITSVIVFIYVAIVAAEEAFLENKFQEEYRSYMRSVNRWLPSLVGLGETFGYHRFAWRRVILKEYNSTFTGSTLGLLLIAKNVYDNPAFFPQPRSTYSTLLFIWLAILLLYGITRYLKLGGHLKAD